MKTIDALSQPNIDNHVAIGAGVTIVAAWQAAANQQDIERLIELSDPNIEVVGPRGAAYGHQILRDWMGRAGLTLESLRVFVRDQIVVVAQHGVWRAVDTGTVNGEANLASQFRVEDGRVVQFTRDDDLAIALKEAGLTDADEVRSGE